MGVELANLGIGELSRHDLGGRDVASMLSIQVGGSGNGHDERQGAAP